MCVIILCYTSAPVFYGLDYRFYYNGRQRSHYSLIDTSLCRGTIARNRLADVTLLKFYCENAVLYSIQGDITLLPNHPLQQTVKTRFPCNAACQQMIRFRRKVVDDGCGDGSDSCPDPLPFRHSKQEGRRYPSAGSLYNNILHPDHPQLASDRSRLFRYL